MREDIKRKAEQLYKIARNVPYSTKVYGEKEEEINPKIILRILKSEGTDKECDRRTLLILKYKTLEGIPVEVVMANVKSAEERKNKIEKMVELIENQLRDNARGIEEYKYYKEILDYKKVARVPIDFTLEGLEILSTKSQEEIKIEKTYFINDKERVEKPFTDKEIEEKKKWKSPKVLKYQLWQEGRELILKRFRTEKEKQLFLKGEEIAKIMQGMELEREDTKNENKRKFVANYLLDVFDGKIIRKQNTDKQANKMDYQALKEKVENIINGNIDNRMRATLELLKKQLENLSNEDSKEQTDTEQGVDENEVLNEYLRIKEKGLTIDINIFLENMQNKLIMEIQKQIDEKKIKETSPKDFKQIKLLQAYHSFFDNVKNGKDRAARIYALQTENLNFEPLEKVFENYDQQEIIQYIRLKNKVLEEINTDDIANRKKEYPSVRELYEFLLNSSVRKFTKEDDEKMFSEIFEKAQRYILENNAEEIDLYNYYAKKFKMYECPTYKKEKIEESIYPTDPEDHDEGNR